MTRPARSPVQSLALPAALAAFAAALAAPQAPSLAQSRDTGTFYVAELGEATQAVQVVAGGVVWSCEGTSCLAPRGTARPLRICRELKRKTGSVTSFAADGDALPADQLARCNA